MIHDSTWHDIIPDSMIQICYATKFDLFWFKRTSMQCTTSSWDVLNPRYHSNIGYWYRIYGYSIYLLKHTVMCCNDAIWFCWVWHTIYMVQFDMIWYGMIWWYDMFHFTLLQQIWHSMIMWCDVILHCAYIWHNVMIWQNTVISYYIIIV